MWRDNCTAEVAQETCIDCGTAIVPEKGRYIKLEGSYCLDCYCAYRIQSEYNVSPPDLKLPDPKPADGSDR